VEESKKTDGYCPMHNWIKQEIEQINDTLWSLQCERQDIRLDKLEAELSEQRKLVDEVRRTVWVWKGSLMLAAFIGSIVGATLINILFNIVKR
jgi:Mg2+ and Co2+ transporter CorA